jgi:hypothetical protein
VAGWAAGKAADSPQNITRTAKPARRWRDRRALQEFGTLSIKTSSRTIADRKGEAKPWAGSGGGRLCVAAIAFAARNGGAYLYSDIYGPSASQSPTYFLDKYFVKASDGTTFVTTFNKYKTDNSLQWLNFQNVSSLFYDASNACWAIIGGNMWGGSSATARPVKILDGSGKKTLGFVPALNGNTYNPVSYLMSGNRLFFRDGLKDADGFESGYHKMYVLDVSSAASTPVDVLANVPENGRLEIVAFSVAADTLYFTGVKGTGVVGGKIDLATFAYTPMTSEYMLRDIQVY